MGLGRGSQPFTSSFHSFDYLVVIYIYLFIYLDIFRYLFVILFIALICFAYLY